MPLIPAERAEENETVSNDRINTNPRKHKGSSCRHRHSGWYAISSDPALHIDIASHASLNPQSIPFKLAE